MQAKKISPINITKAQGEWLKLEKERTGNAYAAIVRNLIQEKVEESKV